MTTFAELDWQPGQLVGTSGWLLIDQTRIDRFAEATGDHQFVHVDPVRAAAETPFGGTIAHGLLTLSLVSAFAQEVLPACDDIVAVFIASIEKTRFLNPVNCGSRVRGVFRLNRRNFLAPTRAVAKIDVTVEIDTGTTSDAKPALSTECTWIFELKDASLDVGDVVQAA
jgi:acyl dehydratase